MRYSLLPSNQRSFARFMAAQAFKKDENTKQPERDFGIELKKPEER